MKLLLNFLFIINVNLKTVCYLFTLKEYKIWHSFIQSLKEYKIWHSFIQCRIYPNYKKRS